jgi:hypothetical protein
MLFLVNLKLLEDKDGAIKHVCLYEPQQAPSLASNNLSSGLVPPIATKGAAIGTSYHWIYKKDNLECIKETVKVSAEQWTEQVSANSTADCKVGEFVYKYTERESNDSAYFLLYDDARNLLARMPNIPVGQEGPSAWRLASNETWNEARSLTRVN